MPKEENAPRAGDHCHERGLIWFLALRRGHAAAVCEAGLEIFDVTWTRSRTSRREAKSVAMNNVSYVMLRFLSYFVHRVSISGTSGRLSVVSWSHLTTGDCRIVPEPIFGTTLDCGQGCRWLGDTQLHSAVCAQNTPRKYPEFKMFLFVPCMPLRLASCQLPA